MSRRLRLKFEEGAALRAEYEQNIANGGAFIPTTDDWDLREIAEVEITLAFADEVLVFEAEIVHVQPGVGAAVQFLGDAAEIRQSLEAFLPEETAPPPPDPGPAPEETPAEDMGPELELDGPELEIELGESEAQPLDLTPEELPVVEAENTPVPLELQPELSDQGLSADSAAALELDLEGPDLTQGEADASMFADEFDADALDPSQLDGRDPFVPNPEDGGLEPPPIELESEVPQEPPPLGPLRTEDPLAEMSDRRGSPRAPAHVRARLDSTNVSLDGLTRDLSETGALISADASELPLGKEVKMELTHPVSGERLEVVGKVKRHVETEGTVAAVGVEFEKDTQQAAGLSDFVREAKEVEAARIESGISGVVEEIGMANLLQMLGGSSDEGTLTACRGTEEGVIAFQNGRFVGACLGNLRGVKALTRLLSWTDGTFKFHSQMDEIPVDGAPMPLDGAILEAVRHLDEARRVSAAEFEPTTCFAIDRDALARASGLGKTEEAVLDLVGVGCTVRRILDVIPEPDSQILEALHGLAEQGVIAPG